MHKAIQRFYDNIKDLEGHEKHFALSIWLQAWACRQYEINDQDMLIEALYKKINELEHPTLIREEEKRGANLETKVTIVPLSEANRTGLYPHTDFCPAVTDGIHKWSVNGVIDIRTCIHCGKVQS